MSREFNTRRELAGLLCSAGASAWHDDQTPIGWRRAADLYLHAAELGDDEAAWNLGTMFLQGEGVERDEPLALRLIAHASRHGNDSARGFLTGRGIDVSTHPLPPPFDDRVPFVPPHAPLDAALSAEVRRAIDPDLTPERAAMRRRIAADIAVARRMEAYAQRFRRRLRRG